MTTVVTNAGALAAAAAPGLAVVSLRKATAGAADAKRRGHRISGEMVANVSAVPIALGGARVQSTTIQGLIEEFGSRYRPPHVWFRPSMDAARVG